MSEKRYEEDSEFDGVLYYDVYTDLKTGEKHGVGHPGDTLDLLNTQAETIEVLREENENLKRRIAALEGK